MKRKILNEKEHPGMHNTAALRISDFRSVQVFLRIHVRCRFLFNDSNNNEE